MATFLCLLCLCAPPSPDDPIEFDRHIAPLLSSKCLHCHTGKDAKAKLDLSTKTGLIKGGKNGSGLQPGKLEESLLWQRIEADEMPPKTPLSANEKSLIKDWIKQGAKWGTDPVDPYRYTSSTHAGYDWWAFQPVQKTPPPVNASNLIDTLIRAKLTQHQLTPSKPADRRTLIRRLTFDLLGLPPTPDEVQLFLNDLRPDAYEKLVDRLLASPHYGERWARHWLDIARFGESDGFEFDKMRPNAWRYRDWVIQSLNADMPFDRFTKLQIAGDLLEPTNPDAITATGFLVGGAFDSLLPAGEPLRLVMRQDELEDVVAVVSQSFLGMTVNCARCHDHKFDPIRQTDYYKIASALSSVHRGDRPLSLPIPKDLATRIEKLKIEIEQLDAEAKKKVLTQRKGPDNKTTPPPVAVASWDFSRDLSDRVGTLHGQLSGNAKLVHGALQLDGNAHVYSAPLPWTIREKTLEAWVKLDSLDQSGGGIIALQSPDGGIFDALVFAETEPGRWIVGSEFFKRTQRVNGPKETEATQKFIHLAVTYAKDGTITLYRQGKPYGNSYKSPDLHTFHMGGEFQVIFGLRHSPSDHGRHLKGAILKANLYNRALSPEEIVLSAADPNYISDAELSSVLNEEQRTKRINDKKQLATLEAEYKSLKEAKTFAITPRPSATTHLLVRGNPAEKAQPISPGGLGVIPLNDFALPPTATDKDKRKKLAEWIASESNYLFPRVIINRLWQYHFGRGFIDTPNDLGFSGGLPSHPELLDALSNELIQRRWSLKALHRLIVTSETYKQDSKPQPEAMKKDADNRLLWRFSPRRLNAEEIRDATLSISGQLNLQMHGPGFFDVKPCFFRGSQFYEPLDPVGSEFHRRSIYRMAARGGKNPLLDTFDCPDPSTTTPKRGVTNTPLQALAMWNNSFTLRMADQLAARLQKDAGDSREKQIERGFQLIYGRPPNPSELEAAKKVATTHGLVPFARALLNSNGFLYVH